MSRRPRNARGLWTASLAGALTAGCAPIAGPAGPAGPAVSPAPAAAAAAPAPAGGAGTAAPSPGSPVPAVVAAALAVPPHYRLVWRDEFDRDGLPDPARWAYDTGMNKAGSHNRDLQYYAGPLAENARVEGGRLVITARRESLSAAPDWGGQRYTSTRLVTQGKGEWTYGFFEIRARLPCGPGTWPAIWMLNREVVWPAGGELDILEHIGREPGRVFSTVHTAAGHGGDGAGAARQLPDACSAFHDYQMHWTPQSVRFGIDGVEHFVYRNPGTGPARWPFDAPQFLILNIAIGGDLGGAVDDAVFPVSMEVEHVRVYQAPPAGGR